jgi:RND family efflux transporter MFP subunit
MTIARAPLRPRLVTPAVAQAPSPPPKRRKASLWLWLWLLPALAAAVGGWWWLRPTPVFISQITTGQAIDAVYASGVVEYVHQASIAPVVTAPIQAVQAKEGDTVRARQTLAQLDDGPQRQTALQLAAQASLARTADDRAERLYNAGFGAKAAADDARNQRLAAEAAAASAGALLENYRVKAPFSGRILRRDAEPGDLAAVGTPLFVIADPRSLRVTADVDERDVAHLTVGADAEIRADAFANKVFAGKVSEITPQGDSTNRVFRVRISLDPATLLRPGMTVETNLVTGRRPNATLVPTGALRQGAVWVVANGRAHRVAVRVGAAGADRIEVTGDLKPGADVVLNPPPRLQDGGRVAVVGKP